MFLLRNSCWTLTSMFAHEELMNFSDESVINKYCACSHLHLLINVYLFDCLLSLCFKSRVTSFGIA